MNQITTTPPKLPDVGMDALTRAEIDLQIATARQYPRELTTVSRNVLSLVTMDRAFAESCMYALPRGNKPIVGPSIRLAEVLFSQWGNCTGGSRTVAVNRKEGYVEAEGVFHDLETNAKSVKRVRRSIKDRRGNVYSDDMIIVTANAAGSIAFRNAVLAGVPRAVWEKAYKQAEHLVKGDSKTLEERKAEGLKAMAAFGMNEEEVCAVLGVAGWDDIMLDQIVTLRGLHNSLVEGETTREALLAQVDDDVIEGSGAKKRKVAAKPKEPKKPASEDPKQVETPKSEPDPEVKPEPKPEAKQPKERQPDISQFVGLADAIKNDLMDVGLAHVDDVLGTYEAQIEQMKAVAPDLWSSIEEFITEMRKDAGDAQ